jgi:hypothetical protein
VDAAKGDLYKQVTVFTNGGEGCVRLAIASRHVVWNGKVCRPVECSGGAVAFKTHKEIGNEGHRGCSKRAVLVASHKEVVNGFVNVKHPRRSVPRCVRELPAHRVKKRLLSNARVGLPRAEQANRMVGLYVVENCALVVDATKATTAVALIDARTSEWLLAAHGVHAVAVVGRVVGWKVVICSPRTWNVERGGRIPLVIRLARSARVVS